MALDPSPVEAQTAGGVDKLKFKFKFKNQVSRLRPRYPDSYRDRGYDEPRTGSPEEITRRYVHKLEMVIREDPVAWLWTHRRWKHKPPEG